MNYNKQDERRRKNVYYVAGSGLFPVPADRMNEIEMLKREYHQRAADLAILAARLRRVT